MEYQVIYTHKGCSDGAAAGWILKRRFPGAKVINVSHKEPFPLEPAQGNVIFTDFCPEFPTLLKLAAIQQVESITILDHHPISSDYRNPLIEKPKLVEFVHDETRAGCQIAWDFVYPNTPRPWFINYIADRDRWVFALEDSKAINQGLYETNRLWAGGFDTLLEESQIPDNIKEIIPEELLNQLNDHQVGVALRKYKEIGELQVKKQEGFIANCVRKAYWANFLLKSDYRTEEILQTYRIKITDAPSYLFSEVASQIAQEAGVDFVLCYWYDFPQRVWNFRLRGADRVNLHELTQHFKGHGKVSDGGGHPNAAGFGIWSLNEDPESPHSIHDLIKLDN